MADTKITPRLKALYNDKIAKELQKNLVFPISTKFRSLRKLLSPAASAKREDKKFTETVDLTLTKITGTKYHDLSPSRRNPLRPSKIRKGMGAPVGYPSPLCVMIKCMNLSIA